MSYLIVGASSGLGRELAYEFAKNKKNLILTSRDTRDLGAIKNDLENLYNVDVEIIELNLSDLNNVTKFVNAFDSHNLNGLIFSAGMIYDDDSVLTDKDKYIELFNANFLSISFIVSNLALKNPEKKLSIIGFGSVSGLLGRKFNTYYAASKRALHSYFESLGLSNIRGNKLQFYILGYLNTNLAFGKKLILPKGKTSNLAKKVFKWRDKKFKVSYYPGYWSVISLALKLVPFSVINIISKFIK